MCSACAHVGHMSNQEVGCRWRHSRTLLRGADAQRTSVDVFALLPSVGQSLVSLASIYRWAESQGFTVDAEHVIVHGVPASNPANVQFTGHRGDSHGAGARVPGDTRSCCGSRAPACAGSSSRRCDGNARGSRPKRALWTARGFEPFWTGTASTRRFPVMTDTIPDGVARLLARKQEWHRQQANQPLHEKVRDPARAATPGTSASRRSAPAPAMGAALGHHTLIVGVSASRTSGAVRRACHRIRPRHRHDS